MNIIEYLKSHTHNLKLKDINNTNIENYECFKDFIDEHYELNYMKKNNYIKYVKIIRQKIVYLYHDEYYYLINKINQIINIMSDYHIFFKINFKKYLFNIEKIKNALIKKEINLKNTIFHFQELIKKYEQNAKIRFEILHTINNYYHKFHMFKKLKRKLIYMINTFIDYEESFGIDQKLIQINNMERTLIGKKSEYQISKLIKYYIKNTSLNYIYKENVDIFKLLNIKIENMNFKGEIDGLILKIENNEIIIEHIIEVKSSIKATFEDIHKIIALQEVLKKINTHQNIILDDLELSYKSFEKIINQPIKEWLIYLILDNKNKIDKSHLYFTYVLKIVDNEFINNYYVEKKDNTLRKKHDLILKKEKYIQQLFNVWCSHVNLNKYNSIIFMYTI